MKSWRQCLVLLLVVIMVTAMVPAELVMAADPADGVALADNDNIEDGQELQEAAGEPIPEKAELTGEEIDMEEYEAELNAKLEEARETDQMLEEEKARASAAVIPYAMPAGFEGEGTEESPYLIDSNESFLYFAECVNAGYKFKNYYFKLTTNLDIYAVDENGNPISWVPINDFYGTFDGNNHIISGLYINSSDDFQGLFGLVFEGAIKNVNLEIKMMNISGQYSGGLVGAAKDSYIENCSVKGDIISNGTQEGGVIGGANSSYITNLRFNGRIKKPDGIAQGASELGGIIGYLSDGHMTGCVSVGEIHGRNEVGGIVGRLNHNSPTNSNITEYSIKSNFNKADVYGVQQVGGIIGRLQNTRESWLRINALENANAGYIESSSILGGIIGIAEGNVILMYCYNVGDINADVTTVVGGIVGRLNYKENSYASVTWCYNAGKISSVLKVNKGGIVGVTGSAVRKGYILQNGVVGVGEGKGEGDNSNYYIKILDHEALKTLGGDIKEPFIEDVQDINKGYPVLKSISYFDEDVLGENEFWYASGSKTDYKAKYYYGDDYFMQDASIYNPSLSTMSLNLALSTFPSNEAPYENKSKNVTKLLGEIEFENIEYNDAYTLKPERDSIGVVVGNKKINDNGTEYTLIAVAIRGAGYEAEWASNLLLGESGDHEGFAASRDIVLEFLGDYIQTHQDKINKDVKIWITGYSRASAVANLSAAKLIKDKRIGQDLLLLPENIYAYCYEVPRAALEEYTNPLESPALIEDYKSIHNIINPNDPVPKVAPVYFGFNRYGSNHIIPEATDKLDYSSMRRIMEDRYADLDSVGDYVVDNFSMKRMGWGIIIDDPVNSNTQNIFLNDMIKSLSKNVFKDRSNYVKNYQTILRDAMGSIYEEDPGVWADFNEIFWDDFLVNLGTNEMLYRACMVDPSKGAGDINNLTYSITKDTVHTCLTSLGVETISDETIDKVAEAISVIISRFIVREPNTVVTLIANANMLAEAHYPELCLAWIQSMDPNYTPVEDLVSFSNGSYRIVSFSGTANDTINLEIFDSSQKMVAAFAGGVPQIIEGSSIISTVTEDGNKLIYLPAEGEYSIRIPVPYDYKKMNYSVSEVNSNTQSINRIVGYNDIYSYSYKYSNVLMADIPSYSDADFEDDGISGSTVKYALREMVGANKEPDMYLSGSEVDDVIYYIGVFTNNAEMGIVEGKGSRSLGSYALVTARANEGYEFYGWYEGNTKVSNEEEYQFEVERDIELVAKFKPIEGPEKINVRYKNISTAEELQDISEDLTGSFKLVNDIDLKGYDWKPIEEFSGRFDGNGYEIESLSSDSGLFGSICGAEICNVILKDVNIWGEDAVGALVGYADINIDWDRRHRYYQGNVIKNCIVDGGQIRGRRAVGGLIGSMNTATSVYRSGTKGYLSIDGDTNVGGLVGKLQNEVTTVISSSNIEQCFSEAGVYIWGSEYVGGLVGYSEGGTFYDSYASNSIYGRKYVGGLFGDAYFPEDAYYLDEVSYEYEIKRCFYSGPPQGYERIFTSPLGINMPREESKIGHVYYNSDIVGFTDSEDQSRTTEQMKVKDQFVSYDFDSVWKIEEGSSFPTLKGLDKNPWEEWEQLGTLCNPYLISTPEDLMAIENDLVGYYKLTNDIDLAGVDWEPIGAYDSMALNHSARAFQGTIDGAGYSIKNAVVRAESSDSLTGLFGYSRNASFINIRLENFDVKGNGYTGGLVALAQGSTLIDNCSIDGNSKVAGLDNSLLSSTIINYEAKNCGGLFGYAQDLTIYDSSSSAQVGVEGTTDGLSTSKVGGIGGSGHGIVMERCYYDGIIYGSTWVGGLVGRAYVIKLSNCYYSGSAKGENYISGLAGVNRTFVAIECYSAGEVETNENTDSDMKKIFGLVNSHWLSGETINCYFDKDIYQSEEYTEYGKTTIEMGQQDTYEGWDFKSTWYMNETYPYPLLQSVLE